MLKLSNVKTETYEVGDFLVDIQEDDEMFDMWLVHKDYGVKNYCFGSPKENYQYGEPHTVTKEEFMETVEANLEDYIREYREEVMED